MNTENMININDIEDQVRLNKIRAIVRDEKFESIDMFSICIEDSLNKVVEV